MNIKKILWLICWITGVIGLVIIWFYFPHERDSMNFFHYFFDLFIYLVILTGIAVFPKKFKFGIALIFLPIAFYLGYICPKLLDLALKGEFEEYYTMDFVIIYPLIIYSICFAFRMGGGKPGQVIKIGTGSIILLFSGYLDFMWFIVNNQVHTSDTHYIPHIELIIGHSPVFYEIIIFFAVHLLAIIGLFIIPLDKWIEKIIQKKNSQPKRSSF